MIQDRVVKEKRRKNQKRSFSLLHSSGMPGRAETGQFQAED